MGKVEKKAKSETARKNESNKNSLPQNNSKTKELSRFFGNLVKTDRYKATQGFTARTATAAGLGVIFLTGLYQLSESLKVVTSPAWVSQPASRIGIPMILAAMLAWFLYRLINYPLFAEFLIATEAEMYKVSWTTWADLKRATTVVLVTVVLMTTYLWLVDQVWSSVLTWIGVLRI